MGNWEKEGCCPSDGNAIIRQPNPHQSAPINTKLPHPQGKSIILVLYLTIMIVKYGDIEMMYE